MGSRGFGHPETVVIGQPPQPEHRHALSLAKAQVECRHMGPDKANATSNPTRTTTLTGHRYSRLHQAGSTSSIIARGASSSLARTRTPSRRRTAAGSQTPASARIGAPQSTPDPQDPPQRSSGPYLPVLRTIEDPTERRPSSSPPRCPEASLTCPRSPDRGRLPRPPFSASAGHLSPGPRTSL